MIFFPSSGEQTAQKATTVADGEYLLFPFSTSGNLERSGKLFIVLKSFDFTCQLIMEAYLGTPQY